MTAAERRDCWEGLFSPGHLALAGAALSVILLLQPSLSGRLVILFLALAATLASGRRVSIVLALMVMAGIVGVNLLVPLGRRLATIGPLIITELALHEGIRKALTFEALMFISKACLSSALRLPGRLGVFFSEALGSYDRILEGSTVITAKTFMGDIDALLLSVYYQDAATNNHDADPKPAGKVWQAERRRGDRFLPVVVLLALGTFLI
jgi:hypothetical protein